MQQLNHRDYYLTRAKASHTAARLAASPSIAAIHTEMAHRYERSADQLLKTERPAPQAAQAA